MTQASIQNKKSAGGDTLNFSDSAFGQLFNIASPKLGVPILTPTNAIGSSPKNSGKPQMIQNSKIQTPAMPHESPDPKGFWRRYSSTLFGVGEDGLGSPALKGFTLKECLAEKITLPEMEFGNLDGPNSN